MFFAITSFKNIAKFSMLGPDVTPGLGTSNAYSLKLGSRSGRQRVPPLVTGFAVILRLPVGARAFSSGISFPSLKSFSGSYARIQFSSVFKDSSFVRTSVIGTWWDRQKPAKKCLPSFRGPVQPLGVRITIIGHFGRKGLPDSRACFWYALISSTHFSIVAAIA